MVLEYTDRNPDVCFQPAIWDKRELESPAGTGVSILKKMSIKTVFIVLKNQYFWQHESVITQDWPIDISISSNKEQVGALNISELTIKLPHQRDAKYSTDIKSPSSPLVEDSSAGPLLKQCTVPNTHTHRLQHHKNAKHTSSCSTYFSRITRSGPLAVFTATNKLLEAIPAEPSCW